MSWFDEVRRYEKHVGSAKPCTAQKWALAKEIAERHCGSMGLEPDDVVALERPPHLPKTILVEARRRIVRECREVGLTFCQCGDVINRHNTTVMALLSNPIAYDATVATLRRALKGDFTYLTAPSWKSELRKRADRWQEAGWL